MQKKKHCGKITFFMFLVDNARKKTYTCFCPVKGDGRPRARRGKEACMGPVKKALRNSLALALFMTFLFPLGGVLLGVGLGIHVAPVWAVGIACLGLGLYGCPCAWAIGYAPKHGYLRLVSAIEEEHIYTVTELARQLGLSEKEVRNRLDVCFNKRWLIGYKREADGLSLNENKALSEAVHGRECPGCGAKVNFKGTETVCPYCGTLIKR